MECNDNFNFNAIPDIDISVFFDEYYDKEINGPVSISTEPTMPILLNKEVVDRIFLPNRIANESVKNNNVQIPPRKVLIASTPQELHRSYPICPTTIRIAQTKNEPPKEDAPIESVTTRACRAKNRLFKKRYIKRSIIAKQRERTMDGLFLSNEKECQKTLLQETKLINQNCEVERLTKTYKLGSNIKIETTYNSYTKQGKKCGLFIKDCKTIKEHPARIDRLTKSRTTHDDTIHETIIENYIEYRLYVKKKAVKVEVITSMYFL
jgi:hypothetical protein